MCIIYRGKLSKGMNKMCEITKKHLDKICEILVAIDNKQDLGNLLLDVCTKKEIESIYQRLRVANLLKQGLTFVQIEEKTGISSTTITRVSKCIKNGQGYTKLFDNHILTLDTFDE